MPAAKKAPATEPGRAAGEAAAGSAAGSAAESAAGEDAVAEEIPSLIGADPPLRAFRRIDVPAAERTAAPEEPSAPVRVFTMLVGEALAAYRSIRDAGRDLSAGELIDRLLDRFGIATDQTAIDGQAALVNRETGHVVALDADGDGAFGQADLGYRQALLDAGIDPDWQPDQKIMDRPYDAVAIANAEVEKRKEDERRRLERLQRRQELESPGPHPSGFQLGSD